MKIKCMILAVAFMCSSCSSETDSDTVVNLRFTHEWNNAVVTADDFGTIQYVNAFGNQLSIERLRYLISDLTITKPSGETIPLNNYHLIDLENENTLNLTSNQSIETGTYANVSFIFGFTNTANTDGAYPDLNSASWNVPPMLGGGYHYMQLDGKFINNIENEAGYNFHAIRAADNPGPNPSFPQDTFFEVNLGPLTVSENNEIIISMDMAQWFKEPYLWDLNLYNQMLMPNSTAQILMYENGQNVFHLNFVE
ncbi:MAG: MbnP family protein [Flavobacteriaceae bacterium]